MFVAWLGVIAWIESTMCSKGVIDIGGHCKYFVEVWLVLLSLRGRLSRVLLSWCRASDLRCIHSSCINGILHDLLGSF